MSQDPTDASKRQRMADTVRLIVGRRERAPRSPRMERALKRLIMRYSCPEADGEADRSLDAQK